MSRYKLEQSKSTGKNGILGNRLMHISFGLTLPVVLLLAASIASADRVARDNTNCGIISGQLRGGVDSYGYLDYINPADQTKLAQANGAYFRPHIENLESSSSAMGTWKTLRISPNHHRALYTMMRYYKGLSATEEGREFYSMECLFRRAYFLNPNDATVYMLNGMYYHWDSDWANAEEKYLQAHKLQPGNPQINYNLGLMYFDKGDHESAAKHARLAYNGGYPLEGLRNKLKKANITLD
jgi:tetratricopeptide (TPR) repeat protein